MRPREPFGNRNWLTLLRLVPLGAATLSSCVLLGTVVVYVFFPSLQSQLGGSLAIQYFPYSLLKLVVHTPDWITTDSLFWAVVVFVTAEGWLAFEFWLRVTGRRSSVAGFPAALSRLKPGRMRVRKAALAVVLCSALVVSTSAVAADTPVDPAGTALSAEELTVVTSQGNSWDGGQNEGLPGGIFLLNEEGDVVYQNDSHESYWDVDPIEGSSRTVMYTASDIVSSDECAEDTVCVRQYVEVLNVSTGETTVIHSRVVETPNGAGNRGMIHDVDFVNDTHLLVADIAEDRVYMLNHRTGERTWSWSFDEAYSDERDGGPRQDWTHVNDVELLPDGRIMLSPRNFNRVLFLQPGGTVNQTWTLGAQNRRGVLYNQHNPDYIPRERGGESVLVADSENDRIVEYQRTGDGWTKTWVWQDAAMNWPRDADRLPGGTTLITDTNSNRVFEVGTRGSILWEVSSIKRPYEAERLGTGDESAGGHSAASLSLRSAFHSGAWGRAPYGQELKSILDGIWFVAPLWFGVPELVSTVSLVGGLFILSVDAFVCGASALSRRTRTPRMG
ncbi:aryl-sulfate sulfotransferase [Halobaculum sp. P14]|uniref:aryl-sulfate sulfotransferase n=1 Tax=Halobaculum sp. P14 TaxID=3421638 RepID=UPI003EB9652E